MIEKIEVQGLADLEKKLTKLGAEMGWPALRVACREAMKPVKEDMVMNSPYDNERENDSSPHMKNKISLSVRKSGRRNKSTAAIARVGPTKAHSQKAIAAEYGTENKDGSKRQTAIPFMRPALYNNRYEVLRIFKAELIERLEAAAKTNN